MSLALCVVSPAQTPEDFRQYLTHRFTGWVFGHFFNGWIYRRHCDNWQTELRLHGVWFPISSMACGLLTYGLTMNFGKHWIGLAFGWIMVNIGMVATIV